MTFIKNFLLADPMESLPGNVSIDIEPTIQSGTKGGRRIVVGVSSAKSGPTVFLPPGGEGAEALRDPSFQIGGVNAGLMGNF